MQRITRTNEDLRIGKEVRGQPLYKELSYRVIGVAMEVHKALGPGFPEAVYDEAFAIALREARIPFESQKPLKVGFRGRTLRKRFIPDYDIDEKIIVDLKAKSGISADDGAIMLSYLRASAHRLGILINFGKRSLDYKRVVH